MEESVVECYPERQHSALLSEGTAQCTEQLPQRNTFQSFGDAKSVTVQSIKKAYLDELRKSPRSDDGGEVTALPPRSVEESYGLERI